MPPGKKRMEADLGGLRCLWLLVGLSKVMIRAAAQEMLVIRCADTCQGGALFEIFTQQVQTGEEPEVQTGDVIAVFKPQNTTQILEVVAPVSGKIAGLEPLLAGNEYGPDTKVATLYPSSEEQSEPTPPTGGASAQRDPLALSMTSGQSKVECRFDAVFRAWSRRPGDSVEVGDPLLVVLERSNSLEVESSSVVHREVYIRAALSGSLAHLQDLQPGDWLYPDDDLAVIDRSMSSSTSAGGPHPAEPLLAFASGTFLKWKVEVGDKVEQDQGICVVYETESGNSVEIVSPQEGWLEDRANLSSGSSMTPGSELVVISGVEPFEASEHSPEKTAGEEAEEEASSPPKGWEHINIATCFSPISGLFFNWTAQDGEEVEEQGILATVVDKKGRSASIVAPVGGSLLMLKRLLPGDSILAGEAVAAIASDGGDVYDAYFPEQSLLVALLLVLVSCLFCIVMLARAEKEEPAETADSREETTWSRPDEQPLLGSTDDMRPMIQEGTRNILTDGFTMLTGPVLAGESWMGIESATGISQGDLIEIGGMERRIAATVDALEPCMTVDRPVTYFHAEKTRIRKLEEEQSTPFLPLTFDIGDFKVYHRPLGVDLLKDRTGTKMRVSGFHPNSYAHHLGIDFAATLLQVGDHVLSEGADATQVEALIAQEVAGLPPWPLRIVFTDADAQKHSMDFAYRPLGIALSRSHPQTVQVVSKLAKYLGVKPGWKIIKIGDYDVMEEDSDETLSGILETMSAALPACPVAVEFRTEAYSEGATHRVLLEKSPLGIVFSGDEMLTIGMVSESGYASELGLETGWQLMKVDGEQVWKRKDAREAERVLTQAMAHLPAASPRRARLSALS